MQVTIGICAYNEEKNIGRLLENLTSEDFEFDLKEILVVASGCTDRTEEIVRSFVKRNKKVKLIVERKRKGKASAINLILKRARGNIIAFVCADNLPKVGSINKLIKPFCDGDIAATSGHPIPVEKEGLFGYASELIWKLHHKICKKTSKISGELCAIRKRVINSIPFNTINDDSYFAALLLKKGYKIAYIPEAITYVIDRNSLSIHLKRRRRIARGYLQLREFGMPYSVSISLISKSLRKEIRKRPRYFFKILFIVILELIANLLAYYDTLVGNTPYCWEK